MPQLSDGELKKINDALTRAVDVERRNKQLLEVLTALANSLTSLPQHVMEAVSHIRVDAPEIPKISVAPPVVNVASPKMPDIPPVKVEVDYKKLGEGFVFDLPKPNITVKVPKPTVNVSMPTKALTNEMRAIKKAISTQQEAFDRDIVIPEYTREKPMPVIPLDALGKPWQPLSGARSAISNMIRNQANVTAELGSGTSEQALRVVHATDAAMSVSISGFTTSIAVMLENADGTDYNSDNPLPITTVRSAAATTTAVTVGADSATQVVATNLNRKSVVFVHNASTNLYISTGTASSATTFPLVANQIYGFDDYTGPVSAILQESGGTTAVRYIEVV